MGVSPEYVLDEMSFDEITELLKAHNEREKRTLERERLSWYYTIVAQQGTEKLKSPEDLVLFEWEKKTKKEGRKLSKEELKKREEKVKNHLRNGR